MTVIFAVYAVFPFSVHVGAVTSDVTSQSFVDFSPQMLHVNVAVHDLLSSPHLYSGSLRYTCLPASTVTFFDTLYSLPSIVADATYVTSPPFSQV